MNNAIDLLRAEFPALGNAPTPTDGARAPIFLDNPGGTQVPRCVVEAVSDCLIHKNANLGGPFATSRAAGQVFSAAHEAMADFYNAASAREIVFGQNMTSLTFHMSRSLGRLFSPGDEIILTEMEHDANFAPWLLMARDHGLEVKVLPFDPESFEFDLSRLDDLLGPRTRLLGINHASNLTGTINDVKAAAAKAKAAGALVYVDSVQFAPHGFIDVQDIGADMMVCSPYKFFGPHMGVLWAREALLMDLEPYKVRAAGDGLPDRFETGTLSHEAMAGVTAVVDYLDWIGSELADPLYRARYPNATGRRRNLRAAFDFATDYETPLTLRLIEGICQLPGTRVLGITNPNAVARRVPTVSFIAEGHAPSDIAGALGQRGIQVWSGHNYALEPARALGVLESGGVVRIGLAHYNTLKEVEETLTALEEVMARSAAA